MLHSPAVILLKQTSFPYFAQLCEDMALRLGRATVYTGSNLNIPTTSLRIIAGPPYRKRGKLSRLWSWVAYFLGAARVVWEAPASDLLFIVAEPPFLPVLGHFRNMWFGQKYVVWVDDIYPDVLIRCGELRAEHPVVRGWRWVNRLMLRRAERIFTISPLMAQVLNQYVGGRTDQIEVIPTWADTESIRPMCKESNPFACQYGQVGKLTIQYSGNVGVTHELDTMIKAAGRLQDYSDIHFMIIGSGAAWEEASQRVGHLNNITMLPFQPEDVVPYSLPTADVSVVTLKRGIEGVSMPSKTYHAMAAGSAVLGVSHSPSDLETIIDRYECGVNVEPGDIDGFVQAVLLFRQEEYLATCRKNARQAAETAFSRTTNVQRVFDVIEPFIAAKS